MVVIIVRDNIAQSVVLRIASQDDQGEPEMGRREHANLTYCGVRRTRNWVRTIRMSCRWVPGVTTFSRRICYPRRIIREREPGARTDARRTYLVSDLSQYQDHGVVAPVARSYRT